MTTSRSDIDIRACFRHRIPTWLRDGVKQGRGVSVLVVREPGQRSEDALVCMSLSAFQRWTDEGLSCKTVDREFNNGSDL